MALNKAVALLNEAERPFVVFGQGVVLGHAEEELKAFLEKGDIPAGSTLLGLSALPSDFPLYRGMIGMHGNVAPNILTNSCDVLVAVGMRFDDRVTGTVSTYARQAKVIHIDIDTSEIGKIIPVEVGLRGDAKKVLKVLTERMKARKHPSWNASVERCDAVEKEKVIDPEVHPGSGMLRMGEVVDRVVRASEEKAVVVTDVGQNQMICISNCDKITPGMLMAAMRLNIPAVFVSGGPMEAGVLGDRKLDLIDAMVMSADNSLPDEEVAKVEASSCPGCGCCSGMFTANSMNCLTEAIGLALPGNGTVLATHRNRTELFKKAAALVVENAWKYYQDGDERVLPRSIATRGAFLNAMALDIAMGGSTNTVLHLLAVAQEAGVDFTMADIDELSQRDFLSDSAVFRHVVLEGEDAVAQDAAAFADRHLRREVLGIEKLLAVGRVGETVVFVPEIVGQVLGSGGCRDAEDFFKGHVRNS